MDMVTFRSLSLVLMVIAFTGIVIWAFSSRRKRDFDEAARLALDDDDQPPREPREDRQHDDRERRA